ncbi:MAG: hypothetical protein A2039_01210 [Candidatus Melainabacteria bacterium GWA2_34_9]|nr:MAG: hypothetical protein A2039_01210 [Candidatus Melainabacteria bacterium GWA2_34_9]
MIIKIIFLNLIFASLLNPQMLIQDSYYPSGNKDADKIYPADRPSKKYPHLNLDITAYDSEFNKIEPGIYSVEYSPEFNILLISDGQNIIKSPVFQVIKLSQKTHIPSVNVSFIKDDKVFIIYKKDNVEVQSFLYLPKAVLDGN